MCESSFIFIDFLVTIILHESLSLSTGIYGVNSFYSKTNENRVIKNVLIIHSIS